MGSPPKPWERAGAGPASISSSTPSLSSTPSSSAPQPPQPSSSAPSIPERPAALSSTTPAASQYPSTAYGAASPYNRFGSSYGGGIGSYSSGYGGYGGLSSYGGMGGYNSFGSYGSYGGYGGMGMGGYGGGMGYGGMPNYGAMPGQMQFDPHGNPLSLTQTLEFTTHTTFALLHSLVQTFTGMAQMLESTFMATHSSFFAMVGVVEQFSQLRNAIGSVLGLFGLVRWLRDLILGRQHRHQMGGEFRDFVNGKPVLPTSNAQQLQKANKKPIIIFLLAIFGIPYAMHKLLKLLSSRANQNQTSLLPPNNNNLPPLDPTQLQFARALYPFQSSSPNELSLKVNDIVAIMAKLDSRTGMEVDPRVVLGEGEGGIVEGDWWKGRTREGREGWFPKKWVEVLERKAAGEGKKVD